MLLDHKLILSGSKFSLILLGLLICLGIKATRLLSFGYVDIFISTAVQDFLCLLVLVPLVAFGRGPIKSVLAYILLWMCILSLVLYNYFLDLFVFNDIRLGIHNVMNLGMFQFSLEELVRPLDVWLVGIFSLVPVAIGRWFRSVRFGLMAYGIVILFVATCAVFTVNRFNLFNPFFATTYRILQIKDEYALSAVATDRSDNLETQVEDSQDIGTLNPSFALDEKAVDKSKIIVLVLEGMPSDVFYPAFDLASKNWRGKKRTQVQRYTSFYTRNQDSATSLLTMLTGRWIPFPAYSDGGSSYESAYKFKSLIDTLNEAHFRTTYSIAKANLPAIQKLTWKKRLFLSEDETKRLSSDFLCIQTLNFENSCEDFAVLSRLIDEAVSEDKVFLLHEMIIGHTGKYQAVLNEKKEVYYSKFIQVLIDKLIDAGIWNETLFIVVGDHGRRFSGIDYLRLLDKNNLRIPLMLISSGEGELNVVDLAFAMDQFPQILTDSLNRTQKAKPIQTIISLGDSLTDKVAIYGVETDRGVVIDLERKVSRPRRIEDRELRFVDKVLSYRREIFQ